MEQRKNVGWSDGHVFMYLRWMAERVRMSYLEKRRHQEALWKEGMLLQAVWCFGQSFAGKPCVQVFMIHITYLNIVSGLSHYDNALSHTANIIQEWIKKLYQRFQGVWPSNYPDFSPIEHLRDVRENQFNPWRHHLTTHKVCIASARFHSTPSEGTVWQH